MAAALMTSRYKTFPPGWNNIQVPTHRRGAALAAIATYAPCTTKGVWAQRAAWTLVSLGGPRLLPGRSRPWQPPLPAEQWAALQTDVASAVGRFDGHTVYQRPDGRQGLLMVLLDGDRSVGFVKVRGDDTAGLLREEAALLLAERADRGSFVTPRVLGSSTIANWRYLVLSPMPPQMHRMLRHTPDPAVFEDIAVLLGGLEKPSHVPSGWEPMHGDFAPWNLRRIGEARPWLTDWEEADWGPPDADRVYYEASARAIGHPVSSEPLGDIEAVRYWRHVVERRRDARQAQGLKAGRFERNLLDALGSGRGL